MFSKALGFADLSGAFWPMLLSVPVIIGTAIVLLRSRSVEMNAPASATSSTSIAWASRGWSLWRDPMVLVLIVWCSPASVTPPPWAMPETLHNVPIAMVDEDDSALSQRIVRRSNALLPHAGGRPERDGSDMGADRPVHLHPEPAPNFQRDVLWSQPAIQLNVHDHRVNGLRRCRQYIQNIGASGWPSSSAATGAVGSRRDWWHDTRVQLNLTLAWFGSPDGDHQPDHHAVISLTGAALIRERERSTIEHLLVMPVTPLDHAVGLGHGAGGALAAAALSLLLVVQALAAGAGAGSLPLCFWGRRCACSPPPRWAFFSGDGDAQHAQLGMLLDHPHHAAADPLRRNHAAGKHAGTGTADHHWRRRPRISSSRPGHPPHRGASLDVVWRPFLWMALIGAVLFALSLARFRKTIAQMADTPPQHWWGTFFTPKVS